MPFRTTWSWYGISEKEILVAKIGSGNYLKLLGRGQRRQFRIGIFIGDQGGGVTKRTGGLAGQRRRDPATLVAAIADRGGCFDGLLTDAMNKINDGRVVGRTLG